MILLFTLLGCYVCLVGILFAAQRALLFPAPHPQREPSPQGVSLLRLFGPAALVLHLPAPPGAPTLVHFHGNAEQLADMAFLAHLLHDAGLGVYAVEYPGYGLCPGLPSEEALYAAAERALLHLEQSLGVQRQQIVLMGQSLGTGVATEMARRGHGSGLVLISPYTSMVDMARRALPFLPVSLLLRDRFDTARKAPSISLPVLLLHGTEDDLIPVAMAQRLAGLFPRASLHLLPGAHHNDVWDLSQSLLVDHILRFARHRHLD